MHGSGRWQFTVEFSLLKKFKLLPSNNKTPVFTGVFVFLFKEGCRGNNMEK